MSKPDREFPELAISPPSSPISVTSSSPEPENELYLKPSASQKLIAELPLELAAACKVPSLPAETPATTESASTSKRRRIRTRRKATALLKRIATATDDKEKDKAERVWLHYSGTKRLKKITRTQRQGIELNRTASKLGDQASRLQAAEKEATHKGWIPEERQKQRELQAQARKKLAAAQHSMEMFAETAGLSLE